MRETAATIGLETQMSASDPSRDYIDRMEPQSIVERQILRWDERRAEIFGRIASTEAQISIVERSLEALSEPQRDVIDLRYFRGRSRQEISDEIGQSLRNVDRLRKAALEELYSMILGEDS